MANLAAFSSVTLVNRRIGARGRHFNKVKVVFGDSASNYPSGGLAITKGQIGFAVVIESINISTVNVALSATEQNLGYDWDDVGLKLQLFNAPGLASHTHSLFLKNADQADGATTRVNAAAAKLGANSGSDLTIAGVPDATASGGIINVAAGAAGQLNFYTGIPDTGSYAILECIGY